MRREHFEKTNEYTKLMESKGMKWILKLIFVKKFYGHKGLIEMLFIN
jgi:hypothetical protein